MTSLAWACIFLLSLIFGTIFAKLSEHAQDVTAAFLAFAIGMAWYGLAVWAGVHAA